LRTNASTHRRYPLNVDMAVVSASSAVVFKSLACSSVWDREKNATVKYATTATAESGIWTKGKDENAEDNTDSQLAPGVAHRTGLLKILLYVKYAVSTAPSTASPPIRGRTLPSCPVAITRGVSTLLSGRLMPLTNTFLDVLSPEKAWVVPNITKTTMIRCILITFSGSHVPRSTAGGILLIIVAYFPERLHLSLVVTRYKMLPGTLFVLFVFMNAFLASGKHTARNITFPDGFVCGKDNPPGRYMVIGENTKGGAGNFLIFYPAAYALAVLQGRELVTMTGTHPHNACYTQHNCTLRSSDTVKSKDPDFKKKWVSEFRSIKAWDMYKYAAKEDRLDTAILHPKGFQEKAEWWTHNTTLVECMERETGCPARSVVCIQNRAYSMLFPGPFKSTYRSKMSITGDDARIEGYFSQALTSVPQFDAALHLRVQFGAFENHTDPNDPVYVGHVQDYLKQKSTQNLFQNFVKRLEKQLYPGGVHPTEEHVAPSVYVASDNEIVKRALSDRLETSGFTVTLSHSDGIRHSNVLQVRGPNPHPYPYPYSKSNPNPNPNPNPNVDARYWPVLCLLRLGGSGELQDYSIMAQRTCGIVHDSSEYVCSERTQIHASQIVRSL